MDDALPKKTPLCSGVSLLPAPHPCREQPEPSGGRPPWLGRGHRRVPRNRLHHDIEGGKGIIRVVTSEQLADQPLYCIAFIFPSRKIAPLRRFVEWVNYCVILCRCACFWLNLLYHAILCDKILTKTTDSIQRSWGCFAGHGEASVSPPLFLTYVHTPRTFVNAA